MNSTKCSVDGCKRDFDTFCVHCQNQICSKHYIEHIKLANDELVVLADRLNFIVNEIQQSNSLDKAFQHIEEWRELNYRRIDRVCDEKKQQVKEMIEHSMEIQMDKLRELSQQVKELIDEGDASFKQIENIKKKIDECHKYYEQFTTTDYTGLDLMVVDRLLFDGDGALLSSEQQIKLNEFYGKPSQKWMLIYKATRDGFDSTAFHQYCDNQGPTMTVIQSKPDGYLFGGYTSVSWGLTIGYAEDRSAPFLFTLTNPHGIPSTKYPILRVGYAILDQKDCGPTFGGGYDVYVCNQSQTQTGSYFRFPWSYVDTTGRGPQTFTGEVNFQTSEIEVYRLIEN